MKDKDGPLADAGGFFGGKSATSTETRLGYLCILSAKKKGVTDD
ncbi:MAG: hypothetical protein ACLRXA_00350 [Clostridium sp.]